jgi:hypothetical protein
MSAAVNHLPEPSLVNHEVKAITPKQKAQLSHQSVHDAVDYISEAFKNRFKFIFTGWYFLVINAQELGIPSYTQDDQVCTAPLS